MSIKRIRVPCGSKPDHPRDESGIDIFILPGEFLKFQSDLLKPIDGEVVIEPHESSPM